MSMLMSQAKRKLPDWLAKPSIIKGGARRRDQPASDKKGEGDAAILDLLDADIKIKLKENNIHHFFPGKIEMCWTFF